MKTEKGDMSGGGRDEMFFVFYLILKQTTLKLTLDTEESLPGIRTLTPP